MGCDRQVRCDRRPPRALAATPRAICASGDPPPLRIRSAKLAKRRRCGRAPGPAGSSAVHSRRWEVWALSSSSRPSNQSQPPSSCLQPPPLSAVTSGSFGLFLKLRASGQLLSTLSPLGEQIVCLKPELERDFGT